MHAVQPTLDPDEVVPRVLVSTPEGGRSSLVEGLRGRGFAVLVAPEEALLAQAASGAVDAVLLRVPPDRAEELLAGLRAVTSVPVVVMARPSRAALDLLLEHGADDVTSGLDAAEVAARVRAVLRRRDRPTPGGELRSGRFVLDCPRHVFTVAGRPVHLSPKEFGLLELLLRRDGRVVTREEALELVWGHSQADGRTGDPTTVDVHVKRLRAKVEIDPANPRHLLTVRGLGYRFEP